MKVVRMSLKRRVLGAALAIVGCSDGASDTADGPQVPPFESVNRFSEPAGNPGANGAEEGMSPPPAASETSANDSPSNPSPATEDPSPNLPVAPSGTANGAPSTPPASQNGATTPPPASNGMNGAPAMAPPPPPPRVIPPLDCGSPPPAPTGGTQACTVNASGSVLGQSWFMWYSGNGGCMTTFGGDRPAFRANWNNSGDYLARMGLQWNETQTHTQLGTIGADLAFTKTGSAGGYSFIGIYGWSNNPLVEYYIVENSFDNGPATPYATTQRGTFNVDGATYRVYSGTKNNQPSIHGTANFQQFFSVRQTPRQCGHVSISEHFKQWQSMGMNLGLMYEARILVEAGGGSGNVSFTHANVTLSGN